MDVRVLIPMAAAAVLAVTACGGAESAEQVSEAESGQTVAAPATEADETLDERLAAAQQRADEADARAEEAERRATAAEERAGEAERRAAEADERVTAAERRAARLKERVDTLLAELDSTTAALAACDAAQSVPTPAPAPAPSDPYLIPSGVIEDGYHVGYLSDRGAEWFSFDMAEILADGSWQNLNPKIRTLPVDPESDYLYGASPGSPIELYVEAQHVLWVAAIY